MKHYTYHSKFRVDDVPVSELESAADVTSEVLELAEGIVEGWYNDGPIDWEDVWDRMDGLELADGTELFTGSEQDNPAMRKIQRHIRKWRSQG